MILSRRQLLKAIPALAAASLLPTTLLRAAGADASPPKRLIVGSANTMCMFNLEASKSLLQLDLPFYAHSFTRHPLDPDKIWAVQRYNYDLRPGSDHKILDEPYISKAVEVSLASGKITRTVEAPQGSVFNGHALFLPGDGTIYIANARQGSGEGCLTAYDTTSGKMVADHVVSKAGIHECRTAQDGTVFLARSGVKNITGEDGKKTTKRLVKGGMVHYDLTKDEAISFTPIHEDEQFLGHFCLLGGGHIIATAVQVDYKKHIAPLVYMGREGDEALTPLRYNDEVESGNRPGELFNVAVFEANNMGVVSSLAGNYVILVDLKNQTLVRKIDFTGPWGIQFDRDKQEFIISGLQYIAVIDSNFTRMRKIPLDPNGVTANFSSGHSLLI